MKSPLSFDSTENFRNKLILKNLKPYKVEGSYTPNVEGNKKEVEFVDYSVKDSGDLGIIGDYQERLLFVQNLYGPSLNNTGFGDVIDINVNKQITSNIGLYGMQNTINSKLESIGDYQERLLKIKNTYKPGVWGSGYGNSVYWINNINPIQTTGGGLYNIADTFNNFLESKAKTKRVSDLYPINQYGPLNTTQQIEINPNVNNQHNPNEGEYDYSDTVGSQLETIGNNREIFLRTKNIFTPASGNDYGSTRWSINDLTSTQTNLGEYDYTDTVNNILQTKGKGDRITLYGLNQYNPQNIMSQTELFPFVNNNTKTNYGEYDFTDSIGSLLELDAKSNRIQLYPTSQYNPINPTTQTEVDPFKNNNTKTNYGEYDYTDSEGSPLEIAGGTNVTSAYIINKYVPGDGAYEVITTIPNIILPPTSEQYYNSSESFVFVPSDYSPVNILLQDDPEGSNGLLSDDSTLANLGAKQLQKEFKHRVALELLSETLGRVNALDSSIDPDSGEISVKPKLDPFNAVGIVSGNIPLLVRNYRVTAPDLVIGKAINFASKLAGLYSPYSIIPDDYFDYPKKRLLNQVIENPVALVAQGVSEVVRTVTSFNIRRGSDLFLAYTSPATRDLLWGQLFYNEYRPDYKLNSLRNPNLFSPKPNYYVGKRRNTILDILSPSRLLPDYKGRQSLDISVYDFSEVSKDFEGDKISFIKFGLNSRSYFDGTVPISGGFTWGTKKSYFEPGKSVGVSGQKFPQTTTLENTLSDFKKTLSYDNDFVEGTILDITQKIVDSGSHDKTSKRYQHVGNAINQVSKVFNDGYIELTKGSRVVRYTTQNSKDQNGNGKVKAFEYCRIFTKDVPYYTYGNLQKKFGNIRNYSYSVLDNTYNLNIAPQSSKMGDSTNIKNGRVKKYMFSLENLAWRTSNKPGYTVDDLPACEKGPNGGRIMWFPPYNLSFDESSKADFTSVDFIGRPEQLYTYKNTQRSGTIKWTILVDHASITNLLIDKELKDVKNNTEITNIMSSFFAGCLTYDLYELTKKYVYFSTNDIEQAINFVKTEQDIKKVVDESAPSQTTGEVTQEDIDSDLNDKNKEIFLFFDNSIPKTDDGTDSVTKKYNDYFNDYNVKKQTYINNTNDKILKYKKYNSDTSIANILDNSTPDFDSKIYVDARQSSIGSFFDSNVSESLSKLDTFLQSICNVLSSGGEVSFDLLGSASSVGGSSYNKNLSKRRISAVKNYILAYTCGDKTLQKYFDDKKLKINEDAEGDSLSNLKNEDLKEIDCSLAYNNDKQEGIYSVQAMACRRTKIGNIKVTPAKKEETPKEDKPESAIPNLPPANPQDIQNNAINSFLSSTEIKDSPVSQGLVKKLIRNLLTECNYFEMLESSDPFIYDGIKSKLKHFNPAFHSITPEGLNSRLTFLQQCMRPGDTIPTVKQTGAGTIQLDYQDAFNSAFGSPPVLVLRIGDFYNTKIIPDNLQLSFEDLGKFDLNPEGIGVQPMFVDVTLSFKFIGGSGLANPISKLQNALSFNYYANTEMYDERADVTEELKPELNQDFLEAAKQNTQAIVQPQPQNNNGNTIGVLIDKTAAPNGGETGTIKYGKLMDEYKTSAKAHIDSLYKSLVTAKDTMSIGGLSLLSKERSYTKGYLFNLNPSKQELLLFGKSERVQNKINLLYDKFVDDVRDHTTPILSDVDSSTNNFKKTDINKIERKLKKLAKDKKEQLLTDLEQINTDIVNYELQLIKNIDKINFITKQRDGYIESNRGIIYELSGTTQVAQGASYPNTFIELSGDTKIVGNDITNVYTKMADNDVIITKDKYVWSDDFGFDVIITSDPLEVRLNLLFCNEIRDNTKDFIDSIIEDISDSDKFNWREFISRNLGFNYSINEVSDETGIVAQYKKQKTSVDDSFTNFINTAEYTKFKDYKPYNQTDRVMNFNRQIPPNDSDVSDLKNIASSVNSSGKEYNLKNNFN